MYSWIITTYFVTIVSPLTGNSRRYRFSELRTKEKHEPGYKIPPKVLRRPDKPNRHETRECHRAPQREAFLAGQGSSLEVSSSFDWNVTLVWEDTPEVSSLLDWQCVFLAKRAAAGTLALCSTENLFLFVGLPCLYSCAGIENRRFTEWIWLFQLTIACVSYTVFYTVEAPRCDWNKSHRPGVIGLFFLLDFGHFKLTIVRHCLRSDLL